MTGPGKTIFLSSRCYLNTFTAHQIFLVLYERGYAPFYAEDRINANRHAPLLRNQVSARAHFVLLLAPSALNRQFNGCDLLLHLINHARALDRLVIPVVVHSFRFESRIETLLTNELVGLADLPAVVWEPDAPEASAERLVHTLGKMPTTLQSPPPDEAAQIALHLKELANRPAPSTEELRAECLLGLANRDFIRRDYDRALTYYELALKLRPGYAVVHHNIGVISAMRRENDRAIEHYTLAMRHDPLLAISYNNLANIHAGNQAYDQAMRLYERALTCDPFLPQAYNGRGRVLEHMGDIAGALADYETALQIDPQLASARRNLEQLCQPQRT